MKSLPLTLDRILSTLYYLKKSYNDLLLKVITLMGGIYDLMVVRRPVFKAISSPSERQARLDAPHYTCFCKRLFCKSD